MLKNALYSGGAEYWRTLFDILSEYLEHPEAKLDGDKGLLRRKNLHITGIQVIGKEAKDLDEQFYRLNHASIYHNEEELKRKILEMTPEQARKMGVSRPTLWKIKRRIHSSKIINYKCLAVRRLLT